MSKDRNHRFTIVMGKTADRQVVILASVPTNQSRVSQKTLSFEMLFSPFNQEYE